MFVIDDTTFLAGLAGAWVVGIIGYGVYSCLNKNTQISNSRRVRSVVVKEIKDIKRYQRSFNEKKY